MKWLKKLFSWILVIVVIVLVVVAVVLTLGAIIPAMAAAITAGWVALGGTAFTWASVSTAAIWSSTLMMAASVLLPIASGLMGGLTTVKTALPSHTTPMAADRAEVEADVSWTTTDEEASGMRASITSESITEVQFILQDAAEDADATTARPLEDTVLTQATVAALAQAELLARLAADEETISRLETSIADLEDQLSQAALDSAQRAELEAQLTQLRQAHSALQALASDRATTIEQQSAQLRDLATELQQARDSLAGMGDLEEQVDALLREIELADQAIAALERQTAASQQEIDELLSAVAAAREARDAALADLVRTRDQLASQIAAGELQGAELDAAETRLARLTEELEAVQRLNLSLSVDAANMSGALDRIADIVGAEPGGADLVAAVRAFKEAQDQLLAATKAESEAQAIEAARQLASAQERFNQLLNERDYDQAVISALSRELRSLESTVAAYGDWINSLTSNNDTLEKDLASLETALAEARRQVVTFEEAKVKEQHHRNALVGGAIGAGLIGALFSSINS